MITDQDKYAAAFSAARRAIDGSGYGQYVSDAVVTQLVHGVADALEAAQPKATVEVTPDEDPPAPKKK